jgi:membrane dipeptidase
MPAPLPSIGAIDLHADTPMWMRWVGYDVLIEHEPPLPRAAYGGHVDVPRMLRGGFAAQFFGLVTLPVRDKGLARAAHEQIDRVEQAIAASRGRLFAARTADDVERARATGTVAALLGIEGAHTLEGRIEALDEFAARGVRYLGLAHYSMNAACSPAYGYGRNDAQGLSDFGRTVVDRCVALGVIVDLAHINRRGFFEALERVRGPVYVSHTGVRAVHSHWRNVDDEQIRAVADRGGAIGVMFAPRFLGRDGVEAVANHLEHIATVAGEDTPALGSDWDGMIVPSHGLRDPSELPNLLAELGRRFPQRVVEKIVRDNALRVLRDVPPRAAGTGPWA